jgi:hypothetical protein
VSTWLSEREQRLVAGAEATPIPTQIVSNGEYLPPFFTPSATEALHCREMARWP